MDRYFFFSFLVNLNPFLFGDTLLVFNFLLYPYFHFHMLYLIVTVDYVICSTFVDNKFNAFSCVPMFLHRRFNYFIVVFITGCSSINLRGSVGVLVGLFWSQQHLWWTKWAQATKEVIFFCKLWLKHWT